MVVRLATKSVYGGLESGGVSQKWAPNGAISIVLVRIAYRFVALQIKIPFTVS
jgi:hypothetical protein